MDSRGDGGVQRGGRPGRSEGEGILSWWLPADRTAVVAVWLAGLVVVSLLAAPAAGTFREGVDSARPTGTDEGATVFGNAGPPGGNANGGGAKADPSADASNGGPPPRGGGSGSGGGPSGDHATGDGGGSNATHGSGSENGSSDDGSSPSGDASGNPGSGAADGSTSGANGHGGSNPDGVSPSGSNGNADSASDRAGEAGGTPGPSGDRAGPDERSPGRDPASRGVGGTRGGPAADGPSATVSTAGPDDARGPRGPGASPGRSEEGSPSSVVEVSVRGASAGDTVTVDVSPPSVEDDAVAFDGISVGVDRGGNFTLEVTNSRRPLPGSPAFEPSDDADALGRIRLEHSIANDEIEDVSFDFRVSKARLRATDTRPQDVALYRHADGSWTALPTEVVGETATHYLLRADSPGMSEFAVGAMRPAFETWWADVGNASVAAGETTVVSGRVTNVGGADGVYEASLRVDGEVVEERRITVAAGGTRQVNFERTFERPGTYQVVVEGVRAGEVSVSPGKGPIESGSVDRAMAAGMEMVLEFGRSLATPALPSLPPR